MTRAELALRSAVCRLASERSVLDVSVSEVCRRADVTRDSFYRFAASPVALLAVCMLDDHDVTAVTPPVEVLGRPVRELTPATRVLVAHIQRNKLIYRNCLSPRMPAPLREALLVKLEEVLHAHAREFPEKLPDIAGQRPDQQAVDVLVHHQASGVVGALEFLVADDGIDDTDRVIELIYAATAPWWLAYD